MTRLMGMGFAVVGMFLMAAIPAVAQTKERVRVGGGLTVMHTDENPVGVAANVTIPVVTHGNMSLGATGDFGTSSFEHFQGTIAGGGVQYAVTKMLSVLGQIDRCRR